MYGLQTECRWREGEEHWEGMLSVHQQLVVVYPILEAILWMEITVSIRKGSLATISFQSKSVYVLA